MILTRFCSRSEYDGYMAGATLVNNTDHSRGGSGGSLSVGFCFTPDEPAIAWRYLKGIVCPEMCMVVEIDDKLPAVSLGRYADYSDGRDGTTSCLKREYCLTSYSQKTAKLIKAMRYEDFTTEDERLACAVIKALKSGLSALF